MKTSDFVGAIAGVNGLARSNRFSVQFQPPSYVLSNMGSNGNSVALRQMLMFCDSSQLPGVTINTTPIRTFGEVREIPYETNYEPITLSFYVDNSFQVKKMFDTWVLGIQDWNTRNFKYYNEYIADLSIRVQDPEDDTKYMITLYEAYPKTVSAIQIDYANREIMKIQVTMMYKYWRSFTKDSVIGATVLPDELAYPQSGQYPTQYFNNFTQFQQDYNVKYVTPESLNNYTGNTVTYL